MSNVGKSEETKKHGIAYKGDFIESLSDEEFNAGVIKFRIPPQDSDGCGESIWGWLTPEDKKKYKNNDFDGEIKAILVNQPINYYDALTWGSEVIIKCHGEDAPTLSNGFIRDVLQPVINQEQSKENE